MGKTSNTLLKPTKTWKLKSKPSHHLRGCEILNRFPVLDMSLTNLKLKYIWQRTFTIEYVAIWKIKLGMRLNHLILLGLLLSGFYGFAQSKQHFFNCAELNSGGSLILTSNFQVKDAQKPRVYQKQALTSVLYSGFNNRECGNQNPLLTTSEAQEKISEITVEPIYK